MDPASYCEPNLTIEDITYQVYKFEEADLWLEAHEKHLEQSPPTEMEFYPVPPTPQYHLVPAKKPQQGSTLATPLFRPEINLKYPPFSRQYHPAPTQYHPASNQYHPAPNQYHPAPTQYQPVPTPYKSQLPKPQYSLVQHKYRPIQLPDVTKPPPMYNIPVAAVAPVQYVADQWLEAHEKHLEQSPPTEMEFYPVPPTPQYHLVPAKKPQQRSTLATPLFRPEINLKYPPFSRQYHPAPTQYHPAPNQYHRAPTQYQPVPTPYKSQLPTPQYSLVQHKYCPIQLPDVTKPPPMYNIPVAAVAPVQWLLLHKGFARDGETPSGLCPLGVVALAARESGRGTGVGHGGRDRPSVSPMVEANATHYSKLARRGLNH
ncbi:uncharacterized protein LOC126371985 [Pectinophora gossypiella]|uniref:uncharacterized protein LOC126371985 n=1 Tax=Pectinophora gossypiella TaxID=13191 RepID=UPI00214E83E4|nr:uncharacterized protein LOC126371985 [Pectinophora gossypiella]